MEKLYVSHGDIMRRACAISEQLKQRFSGRERLVGFAVPRGGIPAAYAVRSHHPFYLTMNPAKADFIIDDLVDSGATKLRYSAMYPGIPFFCLMDKTVVMRGKWIVFPWERGERQNDESATDNITRLIEFIGEDPNRGGLKETPKRVIKAYEHFFSGYKQDPSSVFKTFKDGGERYDQMVLVKDIPFFSHCEHHMVPFFGTASIAYIPGKNGKIVGLSKLSRLLDIFAHRLQVQERLTNQIVDAIEEHLRPTGVGCVIKARHLCMEARGIQKQGHFTLTSALRGVIMSKPEARAEFMQLAK